MRFRNLAIVLTLTAVHLSAQTLPKFHDASIPDITAPQLQAQVVSPMIYAQLGSQDKALQTIEGQIAEVKADISTIKNEIKPLQETDIRTRFILSMLGWLLGIILTSGLGGWFIHFLHERAKRKAPPTPPSAVQTGSVGL